MAERILIVDDEETLCEVLKLNLENEGYDVDVAFTAEQALTYDLKKYSLILLDIMMGEISGIKMAKILKENVATAEIPIIFCTARDTEDDMIMGLNIGADDYIMKPYTIRNVIARVKSVLRRTSTHKNIIITDKPNILKVEGLQLDLGFKRCTIEGREIKLAKKEFFNGDGDFNLNEYFHFCSCCLRWSLLATWLFPAVACTGWVNATGSRPAIRSVQFRVSKTR